MLATWVKKFAGGRDNRRPLFERLMSQSYRQSYNMAFRLTGNSSDAEDLLQETYVRAFRFFHRYDEALPFCSWLYRIMTNVHIDTVRKRSRLKTVSFESGSEINGTWEFADDGPTAEAELLKSTLEEPIQLGLKSMTPEFRTAVVLADVDGLSYEEIAEIMHTSIGTVRSRIHRGRKQLRTYLEDHGEVELL
ncbi:MAG: sigma-70 family RNA polymerase sigma factor [Armatimonadetes bacterium]|nr:sigma-70 family RNA polymerase sigma factor [Armatimonadota bacterium]